MKDQACMNVASLCKYMQQPTCIDVAGEVCVNIDDGLVTIDVVNDIYVGMGDSYTQHFIPVDNSEYIGC